MRNGFLISFSSLVLVASSSFAQTAFPWYPNTAAEPVPPTPPMRQQLPPTPYAPPTRMPASPYVQPPNQPPRPRVRIIGTLEDIGDDPTVTSPVGMKHDSAVQPAGGKAEAGTATVQDGESADTVVDGELPQAHAPGSNDRWNPFRTIFGYGDPNAANCIEFSEHEGCSKYIGFWVGAEYLIWASKSGPIAAPLVTSSPTSSLGVLGKPGTMVIFGQGTGNNLEYGAASGARLFGGFWFNQREDCGLESSTFALEKKFDRAFSRFSDPSGSPLIASPFKNAITKAEASSFGGTLPGQNTGGIVVTSATQTWGTELNAILGQTRGRCWRTDLLIGGRYMQLEEDLDIARNTDLLPGITVPFNGGKITAPANVLIVDDFGTRNRFYGGQVGWRGELNHDRFYLGLTGKLGIGSTYEEVTVIGNSIATTPAGVLPATGGLLALKTNIGRTTQTVFSTLPEGEFRIGCRLTPHVTVTAAYNFIYWSNVVRPGEQLNRLVNPTQLPTSAAFGTLFGPPQPALPFHQSDFWVQGASLGLIVSY
jgi:hypothetical protein